MTKVIGNFKVIESKRWRNVKTGQTASIYGSVPYQGNGEDWQIERIGWTLKDLKTGTVGIGRAPFTSKDEAIRAAREMADKQREYVRVMEKYTTHDNML